MLTGFAKDIFQSLCSLRFGSRRNRTQSKDYAETLRDRIVHRAALYPHRAEAGQFSLITCLYERSPAGAFKEAADSVLRQTSSHFQWVILAQGPIGSELNAELVCVAGDPRVMVLRHPANRGIIAGMRQCVENASGRYIIPLDGDDLLTLDALSIVASWLRENPAALVYSDEDHLIGGEPKSPFVRPDWDPILNLSCSYIFHLMAFDRKIGMELGVFSDPAANWCQDWDTVFRFIRGGHTPAHIAEVLYHWRAHEASQTNKADPHEGSLGSQRHLLEEFLSKRADRELFEIKPFPIFRGAQEWWLSRRHVEPASIDLAVVSNTGIRADQNGSYPFSKCVGNGSIESFADFVANSSSSLVAVIHGDLVPADQDWPWEAQGLFGLHSDMALLAGRILNPSRLVLGGPEQIGADGSFCCVYRGMAANDPGEMAMALKPHTVICPNSAFFVARTDFLRESLGKLPREASLEFIGPWLSMFAHRQGHRIGYSPLVAADAPAGIDCVMRPSAGELKAYLAAK